MAASALTCVECDYSSSSRADSNEHEFDRNHHVMDHAGFEQAKAKLDSGQVA